MDGSSLSRRAACDPEAAGCGCQPFGRALTVFLLVLVVARGAPPVRAEEKASAAAPGGPMATTRSVLERTHTIVAGAGDRNQKLAALKELLRSFLDTDALGRKSMGKHLDGKSKQQIDQFQSLFRELFIRTYVQRLLLFEVPEFAYGEEKITGDHATVGTEIVTERDRFSVDYDLEKTSSGWRATDILVEGVSLAENFRSQFDRALANDSFDGLLARLKSKLENKPDASAF